MTKGLQKYLLLFVGLALFLAVYFLVYMNYSDKTDALNKEITELTNRLDLLEGYESRLPEFRQRIEDNRERIGGTLGGYYSMEWPEDFIMFAATMENQIGVDVASMSFTQPAPVFELAGVQEPDSAVSSGENTPLEPMTLTAYGISSTLKGTMTYTQMKTLLDRIYAQKDVTKLDSLDVSYDNTSGLLLGDLTLSKYFITGRDIPEHSPVIPYASIGNDHLMG